MFAPLVLRYAQRRNVKKQIAKAASELICDNMTIFIGGSSTTQFLGKYLPQHKNITVITNNLNLASHLSEAGVRVISLGGTITEPPYIVGGADAVLQAQSYAADIMFFSTFSVTEDGKILGGDRYLPLLNAMYKNSKKRVYLCDSSKFGFGGSRIIFDFSQMSAVISDNCFTDDVKNAFPETEFIDVNINR